MVRAGWRRPLGFAAAVVFGLLGTAAVADEADLPLAVLQDARALAARGEIEAALVKTERALAFARAEHGPYDPLVGFILDDLAGLNYRLGRLEEALGHAREALPVIRAARGPASIGHALVASNLSSILSALGRDDEALPLLEEALPVLESGLGLGHARTAAVAQNLALVQARLEMPEAARRSFDTAIAAWRALGGEADPRMLRSLLGRAELALDTGDSVAAAADAGAAIRILEGLEAPPADDLAAAALLLAESDLRAGRPDDALGRLETTAGRLDAIGASDEPAGRRLLDRLATLHLLHREYARAEALLVRVAAGGRAADVARADRLARLGEARIGLGRLDEAERDLRAALDLLDVETPPPELTAAVRRDLARLELTSGQAAEAAARLEAMLTADAPHRARTQALLGHARMWLGDPAAARAAFESALAGRSSPGPVACPDPADLQIALADLDLADGDFAAAKERLRVAAGASSGRRAGVLVALADLELADGRTDEALELIRAGIADIGQGRAMELCPIQAGPAALRDDARRLLERALETAAAATTGARRADHLDLMLEIAQLVHRIEGEPVRDAMAPAVAAGDRPGAALLRERTRLDRAIAGRRSLLARHRLAPVLDDDSHADVVDDLRDLERRRAEVSDRFRREADPVLRLADPAPVTLADLQQRLGDGEAVLVQVTSALFTHLFLVRPDSVGYAQTEVAAGDLGAWVEAARGEITGEDGFDSFPLHALYVGLVGPFAATLDEVDHLLVLPDRAMRDLPFGVLVEAAAEPVPPGGDPAGLDFLIERVAIGIVPDLGVVGQDRGPSAADLQLIGLAAPASAAEPVPDQEREAWLRALGEGIADGSDDSVLDLQAQKAAIESTDLARFRVVGLAMPTVRDAGGAPALSVAGGADSTPGGGDLLAAPDVARLGLDADLVVLDREGEAGAGLLAPAFLVAGARSVAVAHWPAPPPAAAAVGRAARAIADDPELSPAAALRRAVLPLVGGERGADAAHPRVWGAFSVLSGS